MSADDTVSILKRRLWIERCGFLGIILGMLIVWTAPQLFPSVWAVYVDGKPVVGMRDRGAMEATLQTVRAEGGPGASFIQRVKIDRADPKNTEITDSATALERLQASVKLRATRGVIYIDDQPVVALPNASEANRVLEGIKSAVTGKVEAIDSAPHFKEKVEVRTEPAEQELWADAETAAGLLNGEGTEEGTHTVEDGENAWSIAKKYKLSRAEFRKLNPDVNPKRIHVGDTVRVGDAPAPLVTVVTAGRVTRTQAAPVETVVKHSPKMYVGKTMSAPGKPGKERVTFKVEYENGRLVKEEPLSRELLSHGKPKIVVLGEKPRPRG